MISLAEKPRRIELDDKGDDKASVNKIGGKYYLTYGGFYAIGDSVYGPYKYMGHTGASVDHTSYFEWNGQLFNAITVNDHYGEYRSSGLCYVHVAGDGSLVTDPLIVEYGVGQYDSGWNRIEAEWFMRGVNSRKVENDDISGFSVSFTSEGSLYFPNIHGLHNKKGLEIRGGASGAGGVIEFRFGSGGGKPAGTVEWAPGSGSFSWTASRKGSVIFDNELPETDDLTVCVRPYDGSEIRLDNFHFFEEYISNP